MAGLEPTRACSAQRILSPLRLPFRHIGGSTAEKCSYESRLRQNESPTANWHQDEGGKGRLLIFLKKNANFLLQRPYLFLEQGITRGCFPLRSGTGSCAAPLFFKEIRHVHRGLRTA